MNQVYGGLTFALLLRLLQLSTTTPGLAIGIVPDWAMLYTETKEERRGEEKEEKRGEKRKTLFHSIERD